MTTAVKAYKGAGMEGMVAKWYARNTAKSMNDFRSEARRVAALLEPGANVLEVAPGPGYFAIELAKLGGYKSPAWTSAGRLSKSPSAMRRRRARVEFLRGSARICPRPTGSTFYSAARRSRIFEPCSAAEMPRLKPARADRRSAPGSLARIDP